MTDFIQYWSTFRALQEGHNPYDPAVQLAIQQTVDPQILVPMMSWNPPWTSVLMTPILALPYETSLLVWRATSILLFILSAWIISRSSESNRKYYFLFSVPLVAIYETHILGQLGAILAIAAALLFYGVLKNRTPLIVVGCILASFKPHLFFIFCCIIFTRKEFWKAGVFSGVFTTSIAAISDLIYPNSFNFWTHALLNPTTSVTTFASWVPASLAGISATYFDFKLPTSLVIIIGVILAAFFIRRITPISLSVLFVISYMFSGYGWVFDQGLFAPLRFLALQFGLFPILAADALGMIARLYIFKFQHQFVWYALLQVLVCIYLFRKQRSDI